MSRSRSRGLLTIAGLVAGLGIWLAFDDPLGKAAPACTKSWDGGAGTTAWDTATNWSPDGVPAAHHVCIPDGATVVHSTGTTTILSLQSSAGLTSGGLTLSGGTLTLTHTDEPSTAVSMTESGGGTLTGDAELDVSGSFVWSGGTQSGTGMTRVGPGGGAHDLRRL